MQLEKLIYLSLEALVICYELLMYDFSPIISRKLIWYKPLQEYTTSDTSISTVLQTLWKTVLFIGTKKMANMYHYCGTSTTKQPYFP